MPYRYRNELQGLAEDINYMADSLENEEQKKNEFLTNISHDIRTPLTTILGYVEMLQEGRYDSKKELNSYLQIIDMCCGTSSKLRQEIINEAFRVLKKDGRLIILEWEQPKSMIRKIKFLPLYITENMGCISFNEFYRCNKESYFKQFNFLIEKEISCNYSTVMELKKKTNVSVCILKLYGAWFYLEIFTVKI